jgi:hypothetical protein
MVVPIGVDGDGEGEADVHPRRVGLDGLAYEVADLGEPLDLFEPAVGRAPREAHQRGVHVDVFEPGELRVEARAEFEERRDAPLDEDAPVRRLQRPGDDLEERRLAAAVRPDDAGRRATPDLEAHVAQGPELAVTPDAPARQRLDQPVARMPVDAVLLRDALNAQRGGHAWDSITRSRKSE